MATSDVTLKTWVNTRMPLSERLARKSTTEEKAAVILSMHNPLESTYDIDYSFAAVKGSGGITQRTLCAATNRFAGKGSQGAAGYGDDTSTKAESVGPFGGDSHCSSHSVDKGEATTGSDKGGKATGEGEEGSATNGYLTYKVVSYPSAQWQSESHAASRSVQPEQRLDFYASVRKEEQLDDENRGGLVGASQRAIDIATKRATAPHMCPPEPHYRPREPVEMPLVAAHEKGLIRRNYLDLVECEHTNPSTEQQMGFDMAPESRLPGMDLSWELPVQSKVITRMGTSEDLFRGYPKYLNNRPVGYAGHVPMADCNLQAIQDGGDARRLFAKSHMTLAVHGGGVDATITSKSLRARHRGGKNAPAPKMLVPKTEESIQKTVEGRMLHQTIHHTVEKERTMNMRDDKRANLYF